MKAGEVFVEIRAEFAKFAAQLKQVQSSAKAAGDAIETALGGGAKKAEAQVGKSTSVMKKQLQEVGRIASGIVIAQAFYGTVNAIESAAAALLDFRIEMENAAIAFETLLGSQQASEKFMDAAKDFAAESPFELVDIEQGAKRLLAFRFQAKSVLPILKVLGDTAAGLGGGVDTLDGIIRAIGQIKTKGKVQAEELMQLAERGVPAYDILREKLGLTQEQIADIGREGISASKAIPALLEGMEEQFGGLSDKLAESTGGLLSNIKDSLKIIGVDIFDSLFDSFQGILQKMAKTLDKWREVLNTKGVGGLFEEVVPDHLQNSIRMIIASLQLMWENTKRFAQAISPFLAGIRDALVVAFSIALPVMAVFGKILSELAVWATQNEGAIRFLTAAIIGLAIASKVAALVTALVGVIRGLAIAARVGTMVSVLAVAIRTLSAALFMNPIGLAITAISIGLIALIAMSDKATGALDRLLERFYAMMGLDFEGVLNPSAKPKTDGINEYLEGLEDVNGAIDDLEGNLGGATEAGDGIGGIGDKTKEAGKKAKDAAKEFKKFTASFDEVYTVPEPDADKGGGDGGGPGGGGPGGGEKTPGGGGKTPGGGSGEDNPFGALPRLPDEIMLPKFVWPPMPAFPPLPSLPALPKLEWPRIPVPKIPPLAIPEVNWGGALEKVRGWVRDIGGALGRIPEGVTALIPKFEQAWERTLSGVPQPVKDFAKNVKDFFKEDIPNGVTAMLPQFKGAWETLANGATNVWDKFFGENHPLNKPLDEFLLHIGGLAVPGGALGKALGKWGKGFKGFGEEIGKALGKIAPNFGKTLEGVPGFISKGFGNMPKFVGDITGEVADWFEGLVDDIDDFIGEVPDIVSDFFGELPDIAKEVLGDILEWFGDLPGEIDKAIRGVPGVVSKFMKETPKFAKDAVGDIKGFFSKTGDEVSSAMKDTPSKAAKVINGVPPLASAAVGLIRTHFSGTGDKVSDAIRNVPSKVKAWMDLTPQHGLSNVDKIKGHFGGLGEKISTSIRNVPDKVRAWMDLTPQHGSRAVSGIQSPFSGLGEGISKNIRNVPDKVSAWMNLLPGYGNTAVNKLASPFGGLGSLISKAISGIPKIISGIFGQIKIPSFSNVGSTIKAGYNKLKDIAGFEHGGIIGKDSIVRVGEKGKREAIVPLQNKSAMQPFADAVAAGIRGQIGGNTGMTEQQILYVGTLIADDRSLRKLEQKMKVIRLSESQRSGQ
jgi:tape measure domain-containing protein